MSRQRATLWAIVAMMATLIGAVPVAAQSGDGECPGEIVYDHDKVPFEFIEGTNVVSCADSWAPRRRGSVTRGCMRRAADRTGSRLSERS